MLTNGVETSRAEDSVLRVCASRGYRHINVFTTPTCIIIADDKFDGLSFMRTIKRRGIDLNKIDLLNTVSRDFVQNPEMTTEEAINKLKENSYSTSAIWNYFILCWNCNFFCMLCIFNRWYEYCRLFTYSNNISCRYYYIQRNNEVKLYDIHIHISIFIRNSYIWSCFLSNRNFT